MTPKQAKSNAGQPINNMESAEKQPMPKNSKEQNCDCSPNCDCKPCDCGPKDCGDC